MSIRRTLEENVFGPFDANDILDEYVTHKKNAPVDLHQLEVMRNGRASGLDESEHSMSKESIGEIKYLGVLHIEDINWVSPNGRHLIQADMRRHGLKPTLEFIYGSDRPAESELVVKVGIKVQHISLTYLTDKNHPNDMILYSLTTGMSTRRLRIVSLSPKCFAKSQEYISTYRFVRLLSDLCRPQIPRPTPEDFFNAFMNHHAKAGVPFSKDTVVELMLKHAKWLIEGARRQVDVQSWKEFAKTKVLDVGEEWDVEAEGPEFEHLDRSTLDSPGFLTLSPKRKRPRSVDSRSSLEYASDGPLSEPESGHESGPERSPSPPLPSPYVLARIPVTFYYAPRVPDNFRWWCEIEGCRYNINMLKLTNENLATLDGGTAARLRLQDWSLSDEWVCLAVKAMVEDHRAKHLESWGLRCKAGIHGPITYVELAEPPEPDIRKDKYSDLKFEFVNLL